MSYLVGLNEIKCREEKHRHSSGRHCRLIGRVGRSGQVSDGEL